MKSFFGLLVVLSLTTACDNIGGMGEQQLVDIDPRDEDDASEAGDPRSEEEGPTEPGQADENNPEGDPAALNQKPESMDQPTDVPVEDDLAKKEEVEDDTTTGNSIPEIPDDEKQSEENEQKVGDIVPGISTPEPKKEEENNSKFETPVKPGGARNNSRVVRRKGNKYGDNMQDTMIRKAIKKNNKNTLKDANKRILNPPPSPKSKGLAAEMKDFANKHRSQISKSTEEGSESEWEE